MSIICTGGFVEQAITQFVYTIPLIIYMCQVSVCVCVGGVWMHLPPPTTITLCVGGNLIFKQKSQLVNTMSQISVYYLLLIDIWTYFLVALHLWYIGRFCGVRWEISSSAAATRPAKTLRESGWGCSIPVCEHNLSNHYLCYLLIF